jgi:hypothetical protein
MASSIAQRLILSAVTALIGLCAPEQAEAAVLGFRNDTNLAVVVQVTSLVNNVPRRGRAQILLPGKFYVEPTVAANKQILIADAKQPTTRILFNGAIAPAAGDQLFSIQVDAVPAQPDKQGAPKQVVPRLKLVPIDTLAKPPAAGGTTPAPRRPQGR